MIRRDNEYSMLILDPGTKSDICRNRPELKNSVQLLFISTSAKNCATLSTDSHSIYSTVIDQNNGCISEKQNHIMSRKTEKSSSSISPLQWRETNRKRFSTTLKKAWNNAAMLTFSVVFEEAIIKAKKLLDACRWSLAEDVIGSAICLNRALQLVL